MRQFIKIFSYIFLILITATLIYLGSTLKQQNGYKIDVIEINGTDLLPVDQYYKFAKLNDQRGYYKLTLAMIKSRLEKHPYVKNVTVYYDKDNKVIAEINEKKIVSILLINDDQFLLTEDFEALPLLSTTKYIDYPAISNPLVENEINTFTCLVKNTDVKTGFKIFYTLKFIDAELYERLSEVNFRNGGDIVLTFSLFDYPVVIGRGNEIRKMCYFKNIWDGIKGNGINNHLNYIDLRYENHIFLGFPESNEEEQI
jgi:cell division protein FtsQ